MCTFYSIYYVILKSTQSKVTSIQQFWPQLIVTVFKWQPEKVTGKVSDLAGKVSDLTGKNFQLILQDVLST